MALAWSLRGQFGHLKGALIPGAAAALIPLLTLRRKWLAATGLALILSSVGFAVGGHLGFGKLFQYVEYAALSECWRTWVKLGWIGGIWGGLGGTFLGFAFSEKIFSPKDFLLFLALFFIWSFFLGVFDWEFLDLPLFGAGWILLHAYNFWIKKSTTVTVLGIAGLIGTAAAFKVTALLLHFGRQGFLGPYAWWDLRDQMIGFTVGASLYLGFRYLEKRQCWPSLAHDVVSFHKGGMIMLLLFIPGVNVASLLYYWMENGPLGMHQTWLIATAAAFLIGQGLMIFSRWDHFSIHLEKTISNVMIFWIWFLSMLAIAKETFMLGLRRWEMADTFFLLLSFIITALLIWKRKTESKPFYQ